MEIKANKISKSSAAGGTPAGYSIEQIEYEREFNSERLGWIS